MKMRQCVLLRDGAKQVAWIDADAAFLGYEVELKTSGEFWKVDDVYPMLIDSEVIKQHERNYLSHREGTDI